MFKNMPCFIVDFSFCAFNLIQYRFSVDKQRAITFSAAVTCGCIGSTSVVGVKVGIRGLGNSHDLGTRYLSLGTKRFKTPEVSLWTWK